MPSLINQNAQYAQASLSTHSETRNPKLETRNSKPVTRNSKPESRNSELETRISNGECAPAPEMMAGILYEKRSNLKLVGDEVYYTNR